MEMLREKIRQGFLTFYQVAKLENGEYAVVLMSPENAHAAFDQVQGLYVDCLYLLQDSDIAKEYMYLTGTLIMKGKSGDEIAKIEDFYLDGSMIRHKGMGNVLREAEASASLVLATNRN